MFACMHAFYNHNFMRLTQDFALDILSGRLLVTMPGSKDQNLYLCTRQVGEQEKKGKGS